MKILFATGHLPSPTGGQAGAKVSYGTGEFFARTDELHLLSFATESELQAFHPATMDIFKSWDLFKVSLTSRLKGILHSPRLPASIAVRTSTRYRRRLKQLLHENAFDAVIMDHTALFQYAREIPSSTLTIGLVHDVLTQSWQRKCLQVQSLAKKLMVSSELSRLSKWEPKAFSSLNMVVTLNGKDRQLVQQMMLTQRPVLTIQPWIDRTLMTSPATTRAPKPGSLLFWGAMDRKENVDAALWTAEEILPRIRAKVPGARLYIAGSKSETIAKRLAGRDDIAVLGFVEDVPAMMATMEIALLALRLGAGIKIKTFECMAAAMPIVTTDVGAEGIDVREGEEMLIGSGAQQLADLSVSLLRDRAKGERIGAAGRAFFTKMYDFEAKLHLLRQEIERAVEQRRSKGL